nr:hypothetical protein [Mycobacterium sp. E3298]
MSEDEYWASEPMDDGDEDEILYEFLIDEPEDLTLVMLPMIDFNLEDALENYYKQLKRCRNKDQIKTVLLRFYSYVVAMTNLQSDIHYLQQRSA